MMSFSNNIQMIEYAAESLAHLCDKVVFLGGTTTELLITDPASMDIRSTYDVDVITKITPRSNFQKFEDELRQLGFKNDTSEDAVICRWEIDNLVLDVMPADSSILGFSNRWYNDAIDHSEKYQLTQDVVINLITPPYFIATKLEAFQSRGKNDYFGSKDLEDIIAVINGRKELVEEVMQSADDVKDYISETLADLLRTRSFVEALPGHLPQDEANQLRKNIVLERINALIDHK